MGQEVGEKRVKRTKSNLTQFKKDMGEFEWSGQIMKQQFGEDRTMQEVPADVFDWAYCITVWKAQGSEWDSVVLLEERLRFMDDDTWRRFLYTGITRARKSLTVLSKD